MQAELFGSHFLQNGPINLIFRPDCYIFKDASLDTHIDTIYVRHLSSVIADICLLCHSVIDDRCQMTDISHIDMGVYGSVWMSGIELQTQNHQNMHKFSLKLKMLNGVIFPLRFQISFVY